MYRVVGYTIWIPVYRDSTTNNVRRQDIKRNFLVVRSSYTAAFKCYCLGTFPFSRHPMVSVRSLSDHLDFEFINSTVNHFYKFIDCDKRNNFVDYTFAAICLLSSSCSLAVIATSWSDKCAIASSFILSRSLI